MGEVKLLTDEQKVALKEAANCSWQRVEHLACVKRSDCRCPHCQLARMADARAVLALLAEIETTERHRHQSHESLHRALLQIEHLEAANASLRWDLAEARAEGAALAQTIMRDEPAAGQA